MVSLEQAIMFEAEGDRLVAILHPAAASKTAKRGTGVVIVVGGPQYRIGSHRQFVLLARHLADNGIPVLRFDYRGMGDSEGDARDFEAVSCDIRSAVDELCSRVAGVERVVLWGLCDAATANAFHAIEDRRIVGQIALNPWVRTEEGEAKAFIRHYYAKRLLDRELWRKVLRFEFDVAGSVRDLLKKFSKSRQAAATSAHQDVRPLPQRLCDAQLGFTGQTLLILSGNDLTAREYEDRVAQVAQWQSWTESKNVSRKVLSDADHTFSRAIWRDQVAAWCVEWIAQLPGP
jgi:exosortase A-associated hydrolase 1